ncbi:MAG: hypothetical protein HUN04_02880 [Desulfobacter sp.]|nr:MAG: hypothetical protein HUN04_02880 [Desulfobacter sp.]
MTQIKHQETDKTVVWRSDIIREIVIVAAATGVSFFVSARYDLLEKIVNFSNRYEAYEIDEWISVAITLVFVFLGILINRVRKHTCLISTLKKSNQDLESALNEVKTLQGLIPICSKCKKIRDDKGYWNDLESYLEKNSDASFSHSLCKECSDELYGNQNWYIKMKKKKGID